MSDKLTNKINDIESSYGLLQHDFESQNESIMWLTSRVAVLEKTVERLASQIQSFEGVVAPAVVEDEQPPHY